MHFEIKHFFKANIPFPANTCIYTQCWVVRTKNLFLSESCLQKSDLSRFHLSDKCLSNVRAKNQIYGVLSEWVRHLSLPDPDPDRVDGRTNSEFPNFCHLPKLANKNIHLTSPALKWVWISNSLKICKDSPLAVGCSPVDSPQPCECHHLEQWHSPQFHERQPCPKYIHYHLQPSRLSLSVFSLHLWTICNLTF